MPTFLSETWHLTFSRKEKYRVVSLQSQYIFPYLVFICSKYLKKRCRKIRILFESVSVRNSGQKVVSKRPIPEAQKIKGISSVSDLKLEITWSKEILFQCGLGSRKICSLTFPRAFRVLIPKHSNLSQLCLPNHQNHYQMLGLSNSSTFMQG